jgi:hypothetical protein
MSTEFSSGVDRLRERVGNLSDQELLRFGRAACNLCSDPKCRETFRPQLDAAREEWRRRHGISLPDFHPFSN